MSCLQNVQRLHWVHLVCRMSRDYIGYILFAECPEVTLGTPCLHNVQRSHRVHPVCTMSRGYIGYILFAECPEEVNLSLILFPVFACIVLIPLLLLCIFIFIRNRRDAAEFAQFMKETDKARWESVSALAGFLLLLSNHNELLVFLFKKFFFAIGDLHYRGKTRNLSVVLTERHFKYRQLPLVAAHSFPSLLRKKTCIWEWLDFAVGHFLSIAGLADFCLCWRLGQSSQSNLEQRRLLTCRCLSGYSMFDAHSTSNIMLGQRAIIHPTKSCSLFMAHITLCLKRTQGK